MRLNWMSLILPLLFLPEKFFSSLTVNLEFHKKIISTLHREFMISIGKIGSPGFSFILNGLFFFILYSNFIGLFPYIFTSTSHLTITVRLILPLWLGYIIFYLAKGTNFFLSHLVPRGTPYALMPFIVIIEIVRRLIRPLTLSVRLAANIIAGHILISLVSSPLILAPTFMFGCIFFTLIALVVLELAVSIIQSYVFGTLLSLYIIEVNSPNF